MRLGAFARTKKMLKKYDWHLLAQNEQEIFLQENSIAVFEINNKKICLTKFRNEWFAFAYTCPHASGILANGYIDLLGNVVCPTHRYKFSIQNGRNTSGEGFYLKTYPVEKRQDGLYVGF